MAKGDVCEYTDQYVIDDLLQAGYIEAVETPPEIPDGAEPDTSDGSKKREKRKKAE